MLRSIFCCCCGPSTAAYTSLSVAHVAIGPNEGGISSPRRSNGVSVTGSHGDHRSSTTHHHHPHHHHPNKSSPFEIEIDESEDEASLFIGGDDGIAQHGEHDIDALNLLDAGTGGRTTTSANGIQMTQLKSTSSSSPLSTSTSDHTITNDDLLAQEIDPEMDRFRKALERKDYQQSSPIHLKPIPTPITLPFRLNTHTPSLPIVIGHSSSHPSSSSATPGPPSSQVPKVIRKKPPHAHAGAQSLPTTPLDTHTIHTQGRATILLQPPPPSQPAPSTTIHAEQTQASSPSTVLASTSTISSPLPPPSSTFSSILPLPLPAVSPKSVDHPASAHLHDASHTTHHTPHTSHTNTKHQHQTQTDEKKGQHATHGHKGQHKHAHESAAAATAVAPTAATAATSAASSSSTSTSHLPPLDRLGIPSGPISSAHMSDLMSLLQTTSITSVSYRQLFSFLLTTQRSLNGTILRPFVIPELEGLIERSKHADEKSHLKRSATESIIHTNGTTTTTTTTTTPSSKKSTLSPEASKLIIKFLHWLVDLRVDHVARTLTFRFDFDRSGTMSKQYEYIDMPSQDTWVLQSRHPTDPFLFHPKNIHKIYRNESHRLCIHRELMMHLGPEGILSIRSGDVSIKKFVSFNCELRTERRLGMIEYDDKKNAFIEMDPLDGSKPLVVAGHYVPRTFDDWLVITVLKIENWIGLPPIGQQAPPNPKMKPHEGYPYP